MIKTLIATNNNALFVGIKAFLSDYPGIEIIDQAKNGPLLLEKLKSQQPDLLVLDMILPMGGVLATALVKENYPAIKILVLTCDEKTKQNEDLIQVGADGYYFKRNGKSRLLKAVKTILEGTKYCDQLDSLEVRQAELDELFS